MSPVACPVCGGALRRRGRGRHPLFYCPTAAGDVDGRHEASRSWTREELVAAGATE